MLYWVFKWFLFAPFVKLVFRPSVKGADNIPARGAAILVSNHLSAGDTFTLPAMIRRRVTWPAKAELFTGTDWRGRVVGYRDAEHDPDWFQDHPFVRDSVALKAQLADLRAGGGGDEPESLLDALYRVSTMEASPKGAQGEEPTMWRYRSDAARVVVVFTDASLRETMSIPEAKGGGMQDVANVIMANRIILSLFAPNFEVYDRLSQIDKSEWEVVEYEGLTAQQALERFTADQANFRTTLKQLAASVSKSAETVAL